ncbi:hypothetical protein GOP47_0002052 [Adiantum capillus-veneris]|uniref:Uncharacterized protein n=2 Tax=Adiantum capillus-veneris TaxID=13818 RepID=A0A9D4VA53_ADICA|nr:hypothetical protein GOP47_0002052 [Adiantum capillus-veneris]
MCRIRKLKEEVESLFMEIIEGRRAAALQAMAGHIDDEDGQQKNDYYGQDLLGLMLAEMEAAKLEAAPPLCGQRRRRQQLGRMYTSRQLMDECKTFFFTATRRCGCC